MREPCSFPNLTVFRANLTNTARLSESRGVLGARRNMGSDEDDMPMRDSLTVVVTSSPVPSNPCTAMLTQVVASLGQADGLAGCRKVIVCDLPLVRELGCLPSPASEHRPPPATIVNPPDCRAQVAEKSGGRVRGRCTPEAYERYAVFIANVRREAADPEHALFGCEVLALGERHGFGLAVKRALEVVLTPYIMVVHHDQRFLRP